MLENRFLYWVDWAYGLFVRLGSNLQSVFLLYMRLTWGHQLFLTGMDKLKDVSGTTALFTKLDIQNPIFHTYEVGILEVILGLGLILGFGSRIASLLLILLTTTALATAHAEYINNFKFVTDPHILVIQEPYPFLITAVMVFVFGPGRVSLDALIKRWMDQQPRY